LLGVGAYEGTLVPQVKPYTLFILHCSDLRLYKHGVGCGSDQDV
jgi:hypothetical protein